MYVGRFQRNHNNSKYDVLGIRDQATFADVATGLATTNLGGSLSVLQPLWGPVPRWAEADPDTPVGGTCQVLYAFIKSQAMRYFLAVVRNSLSDYPIVICKTQTFSFTTLNKVYR